MQFYADFYNENNGFEGGTVLNYTPTSNNFVTLTHNATVPSAAVRAKVYVILRGTGSNGSGTIYIDDFTCVTE